MSRTWRWIVVFVLIAAVLVLYNIKRNADIVREDRAAQQRLEELDVEAVSPSGLIEPGTGQPMLLDLGAGTCIPCKAMQPILEELKQEYDGQVTVQIVDVHEHQDWTSKYEIYLIPTQIFFDARGKELFRHEGFFSREEILAKFREYGWAK